MAPAHTVAMMTGVEAWTSRLQSWVGSATAPTTAAPIPLVSAVVTSGSAPPSRRATAVYAAQHAAEPRASRCPAASTPRSPVAWISPAPSSATPPNPTSVPAISGPPDLLVKDQQTDHDDDQRAGVRDERRDARRQQAQRERRQAARARVAEHPEGGQRARRGPQLAAQQLAPSSSLRVAPKAVASRSSGFHGLL